MTQDEIIEMARQSGAAVGKPMPDGPNIVFTQCLDIYAFAKLVADKERYACMNICLNFSDVNSGPDGIQQDYHAKLIAARGEA